MCRPMFSEEQVKDQYDEAEEALYRRAEKVGWDIAIHDAWHMPNKNEENEDIVKSHLLFGYANDRRRHDAVVINGNPGCLTQIRASTVYNAQTPELTKEIRADGRIPKNYHEVTREHIPMLKEWQRKLDAALPGRGSASIFMQ